MLTEAFFKKIFVENTGLKEILFKYIYTLGVSPDFEAFLGKCF